MKQIIFLVSIIIGLSSCGKDVEVPVKYEVNSQCSQVNVTYNENGKLITQTVSGNWTYEYIRHTGDVYLKASTVCVGANSDVTILGYIDGGLRLNSQALNGATAEIKRSAKDIEKDYK